MRWFITADWQVKFSNLEAARIARKQELKLIKKLGIKGHIDLGDLKDEFNPADLNVVQFQQDRKAAIHEAVKYDITLMGNHDMFAQTAEHKNWFSLFDSVSGHNVQKPQVLELGNCAFACLPFRRSAKEINQAADTLIKEIRKSNKQRKILLFHSAVHGASWNKINKLKAETKVTLESLHTKEYDMCFGGHIHLHQKLADNVFYVGNPYCNDNGEINQTKGFIVYDDVQNTFKRIQSAVPGIYSYDYVISKRHSKKLRLVAGSKIKATVDCKVTDDYHRALDKVASTIEHKYPECIAYVVPKFSVAESKETVEINPDSSDHDKIAQYVKATVPDSLHKKRHALVRYLSAVLGHATSSGTRQVGKLIFEDVEAKNVLTFNKVDFSYRNRGITLIKGKNKDAVWNSNGAGKTNLLSLLPIAVSGQTFKEQKNDSWASDQNEEKAWVRLNMRDDQGRLLSIYRQRRPVKLTFRIEGEDESIGRRHVGKKETQGRIEETLGYTFDTLSNSVYIDASLSNAFLTGTTADRAKLIHQFQNMDRFKIARDRISKELSAINKLQVETEAQYTIAEELIEQVDKDIAKANKRKAANLKELKENYREAKTNYKTIKKSLKHLSDTHKSLSTRVAKKTEGILSNIQAKTKEENVLLAAIETKEEELKTFLALGKEKKCPECQQDLTEQHKKIVINRIKKYIGAKKTDLKKIIAVKHEQTEAVNKLTAPLSNLDEEVRKVEKLLSSAKMKYEDSSFAYDKAKAASKEETSDIRELESRKKKLLHKMKRSKRVLQHNDSDVEFLRYAQEAMSRDGLPAFLNKLLCPLLNRAAAKYSEIFIDKEIQVLFDIEDGHIVPSIINLHGGKSKQAQSMGEKAWAGLITAFALREIAQPTNLLILDEPGTGMDSESSKIFGERLSRLKDRFETILVVSHNDHICNALQGDNTVTVIKQNKVSRIK